MSLPLSANTSACQVKWKGGLRTVLKGYSELGTHKTEKNLNKSEAPSPKHEIKNTTD